MSQESETLQNLRNRRESARLNIEWRMPLVDDAIAHAARLEEENGRLDKGIKHLTQAVTEAADREEKLQEKVGRWRQRFIDGESNGQLFAIDCGERLGLMERERDDARASNEELRKEVERLKEVNYEAEQASGSYQESWRNIVRHNKQLSDSNEELRRALRRLIDRTSMCGNNNCAHGRCDAARDAATLLAKSAERGREDSR